jgi:hypothetical protein
MSVRAPGKHAKAASDMKFSAVLSAAAKGTPVSITDIREAIAEAQAALPTALEEAAKIEAQRRAVLLTASDNDLEQAERQVAERRRTAERLEVALVALASDLKKAETAETTNEVAALAAIYRQKAEAVEAFWKKSYPGALSAVRMLLELEADADLALTTWQRRRAVAVRNQAALEEELPIPPNLATPIFGLSRLKEVVQMPDTNGRLRTPEAILPLKEVLRQTQMDNIVGNEAARREAEAMRKDVETRRWQREEAFNQIGNQLRRPGGR